MSQPTSQGFLTNDLISEVTHLLIGVSDKPDPILGPGEHGSEQATQSPALRGSHPNESKRIISTKVLGQVPDTQEFFDSC